MNIFTYLAASILIILMPGTGVIYTISTGMLNGKKSGICAAAGCTLGIIPHLCMSILITVFFFNAGGIAFDIVKIIGCGYLIYMGAGMIFSKTESSFNTRNTTDNTVIVIRRGILINLLNPKLTMFFFSFLPQYINDDGRNYVIQSLCLGLIFVLLTFIIFLVYGLIAGTAMKMLIEEPKRRNAMSRIFGMSYIVFVVALLL